MDSIRKLTDEYAGYLRDESRTTGNAEAIAFPVSHEEVADILKECHKTGMRITVRGAGTGLAAAAVPNGGLVLSMNRMDRALGMRYENGSYYLRVQPGLSLLELRKMLSAKRFNTEGWSEESRAVYARFVKDREFFFSPDPTETTASLGGMISCNASGARTYMYGPTRPYVQQVTMVLADGRVLKETRGGSRAEGLEASFVCEDGSRIEAQLPSYRMPAVKNASGYYICPDMELIDVLIGSDGTLGVITEAEIRLQPLPPFIRGVSLLFESEADALRFAEKVRRIDGLASLEYFDADALQILRDQKKSGSAFAALPTIPEQVRAVIYTEIHAESEDEALETLFALGDLFEACGGSEENSWVAQSDSTLDRLLFFRHAVPESVNMMIDSRRKAGLAVTKLGTDMSVPAGLLAETVSMYRRTMAEKGLHSAAWGHIGNDHLHFNILPDSEEQFKTAKALFSEWAAWVCERGGAVSAEHGVGKLKAGFLTLMYGEEQIDAMRRLKRRFDPKWQLGCGNLFTEKEGL